MQVNGGGGKGSMLSEINVTPFVDVMLVLLIIFMVTAPMMTQGIDVNLPNVEAPAIPTEDERLIVVLTQDRKVFINETPVDMDSLGPKLAAIVSNQKQQKGVFLRADERIPYGFVMEAMGVMREAGVFQIGMITDPMKAEKPKASSKSSTK